MMGVATEVQKIKDEVGSKRVLLVEGPDDVPVVERFVQRALAPARLSNWAIKVAGKKDSVRQMLRREPTWKGVVDRDEWDEERIVLEVASTPNLIVLPRFTVENFLVVPSEIWSALPGNRQLRLGSLEQFSAVILSDLAVWVRHGVLWKTVSPLWEGLRAKGFKESLASDESLVTSQNDAAILAVLKTWQEFLDPDVHLRRFHNSLGHAMALPTEEQLKRFVHGKHFWERVVYPAIVSSGQVSQTELRKRLILGHPGCPEFEATLANLLA